MNTHPQIRLARKAFDALQPLNDIDWTHHRDKLHDMCKAEERSHRGFLPDFNEYHTPDTATISDAAKLFAVKRVAEYMQGEEMPKGKDFLHIQKSCFYAAGLVDEYRDRIEKLWADFDMQELNALNYTDVVKVREVKQPVYA